MPRDPARLAWPVGQQPGSWPLHAGPLPDVVWAGGGETGWERGAEMRPERALSWDTPQTGLCGLRGRRQLSE